MLGGQRCCWFLEVVHHPQDLLRRRPFGVVLRHQLDHLEALGPGHEEVTGVLQAVTFGDVGPVQPVLNFAS